MTAMEFVDVVVSETEDGEGQKAIGSASEAVVRRVPLKTLNKNLRTLAAQDLEAFKDLPEVGPYKLREVALQVEVSASGGVALIGTACVSGRGAITLKFS